jgi:hypothetical protein
LGTILGNYFNDEMQRTLLKDMEKKGVISVPYVNIHGDVPDGGFPAFVDSPRYATGYTTLFNAIGTVVETHMLKPYKDRVKVTYDYMVDNLNYIDENYKTIQQKRAENLKQYKVGNNMLWLGNSILQNMKISISKVLKRNINQAMFRKNQTLVRQKCQVFKTCQIL